MSPATTPRALIADDQALIRWAVGRTLEHIGFDIVYAATREEAEARLRDATFDVVIMASPFEGHDEGKVLRRIHRSGVRLLVLSDADGAPALRTELPEAVVLEKPFSVSALVSGVRGASPDAADACKGPALDAAPPLEGP